MNLTLIICGIGLFVLVSTLIETKKYKNKMDILSKNHKCNEHVYYQKPMISMTLIFIVCLICTYMGFVQKNDNTLNLGLLLSFLFAAEIYRSYFVARIYTNNEGFIANDKFIKFRSIKTMYKNSSLPFSKWTLMTYSSEKITLVAAVANYIQENFSQNFPEQKKKAK